MFRCIGFHSVHGISVVGISQVKVRIRNESGCSESMTERTSRVRNFANIFVSLLALWHVSYSTRYSISRTETCHFGVFRSVVKNFLISYKFATFESEHFVFTVANERQSTETSNTHSTLEVKQLEYFLIVLRVE